VTKALCERLFRDFAYREIGILVSLVSFPLYFMIRKTSIWGVINDPGLILAQRLRLNRNIMYRDFRSLVAFVHMPLHVAIPESLTRTGINGPELDLLLTAVIES
jgi:hypothetical protein